jgi:hypothetical protein
MAEDPEYSDIRSTEDFNNLNAELYEAMIVAHVLSSHKKVSPEIRKAAIKVELEARETLALASASTPSEIQQKQKEPKGSPELNTRGDARGSRPRA